jgi:arginine utilization regulatory protein
MLPPLRDRQGDLETLVQHFISKYNQALGEKVDTLSDDVADLFAGYRWPGNVRELEHIIEAAMNMVGGTHVIHLSHLPPHIFSFAGKDTLKRSLIDQEYPPDCGHNLMATQKSREQQMIMNSLARSRGNAARAARSLGISPQSFHYKMKKFGIDRKAFGV